MVQVSGYRGMGFGSWSWVLASGVEGFRVSLVLWVAGAPQEGAHWLVFYIWHHFI
jgi:hypothetical protein